MGWHTVGNVKLDVTIAFGDNLSSTIGQECMYEHLFYRERVETDCSVGGGSDAIGRELNGLYLQGALPNLIRLCIHCKYLDNRDIYRHILDRGANMQEVQITVTRCPLNLQNTGWWKNARRLTVKSLSLIPTYLYLRKLSLNVGVSDKFLISLLKLLPTLMHLYLVSLRNPGRKPLSQSTTTTARHVVWQVARTQMEQSLRQYLGEADGATAAVEETIGFDTPSGLTLGLPIEEVEMKRAHDGEENQGIEELGDVKIIKKWEKRSEKDAIRLLVKS
ncbi:hypothetical protein CPB86DRAFT_877874 [Serendipita vermifera]|nr:hypothetical protein CPB86DRAFT_877874 [Serendipita vermifera]